MKIDDMTPSGTRAAETGALRKGWATEMLAHADQRRDQSARAGKPIVEKRIAERQIAATVRRRAVRRDGAATPPGPGGRRAVRLTLATD